MAQGVARIQIRDCSMMVFTAKPDTFFVAGTEAKCVLLSGDPYTTQKLGSSYGLFEGWTYLDQEGNKTNKKRLGEETLPLSEFDITIRGESVNDLTYLELVSLF